MVGQDVQRAGVPCQGAQALGPAAADRGRRPGCSAPRAQLPKEPGQQLPLLGRGEGSGDPDGHVRGGSPILGPPRRFTELSQVLPTAGGSCAPGGGGWPPGPASGSHSVANCLQEEAFGRSAGF